MKPLKLLAQLVMWLAPPAVLGVGLHMLFGVSALAVGLTTVALQWFYNYWYTYHKQFNLVTESLAEQQATIDESLAHYNALEYKKYKIPLTCQGCGRNNDVELDLTNTEFVCSFCELDNAIYINFTTATKTDPVYDMGDILANAT